jgi:hypothetical protein
MFMTRSEYDRGVNTFSPEGRLFQVNHNTVLVQLHPSSLSRCSTCDRYRAPVRSERTMIQVSCGI